MSRTLLVLLLTLCPLLADEAEKAKAAHARIAEITLSIDGSEDPAPAMPIGKQPQNYYAVLTNLRRAAADPELDAVLLKLGDYGVGWARLLEVRDALKGLRRSGKKVFVYKESYATPDLVLASVADRISLPESGSVFLPGIATESLYVRGLLEKLHLRFDVVHIGEYKSAGESFVRDTMSDELKQSLNPILDEFYASMVKTIAEGRGISEDAVKGAIDTGILNAKQAKAIGLVDRIEYEDQFREGVKAFFPERTLKIAKDYGRKKGMEIDPNNPMAALSVLMSLFAGSKEPELKGPKIAVVYCSGPITSGKSQYGWTGEVASMGSETIVKAIDTAREDGDVKAIVLRVNSPGGSGLASDMIWRAVERARAEKPVVASMGDVAASGGYFISMNSHAILAEPQTITGSIGVIGMMPNLDDFYPWIGVRPERLVRGKRAAALMTTKGLSDEDKEMLRSYMKDFYGDFVAKVAAGRGKTPAEIEPIARGRIWSGRDALKIGLVDRLGGLEDAIALARERAKLAPGDEVHILEMPKSGGPFEALSEMFGLHLRAGALLGLDAAALREVPLLGEALAKIAAARRMSADGVCAAMPELSDLAKVGGRGGR